VSASGTRTLVALALQLAALAALSLSLLGFSWLDTRSRPRVLLLVDRSESVPRAASDKAVADVMHAANAAGSDDLQLLEFAGRPAAPSMKAADSVANLEPSATNIEAALDAALAADARTPFAGVVVISDGLENAGDVERALRAARDARLPVQWIPTGRPLPETRISEVLAPDRAIAGQPISLYGDGEQTRDFTFVADAASATATAGDRGRPGAVYNIGGGSRVTLNSVLDRLVGITGRSLDIRREDPQKGDMRDTFADTTRALEDLDFRPTYTLDAGLTAEYEWLAASLKGSRR